MIFKASGGLIFKYIFFVLCMFLEFGSEAQNVGHSFAKAIQLKKGNYWIYESRNVQLGSNLITLNKEDSIFIKSDTIIKNNRFYRLENIYGLSEFKRDSSAYIVDENGNVEFFSGNTIDTLFNNDNGMGFMSGRIERITVPAGTFSAALFYVIQKQPEAIASNKNPTFFNGKYSIVRKIWYVNDIGMVKSIFYYGASSAYEKNLIRYNLN